MPCRLPRPGGSRSARRGSRGRSGGSPCRRRGRGRAANRSRARAHGGRGLGRVVGGFVAGVGVGDADFAALAARPASPASACHAPGGHGGWSIRRSRGPGCRGHDAAPVADVGEDGRLVERHPLLHAVAVPFEHQVRVVSEPVGDRAVRPTAEVLERLGQVPVVEGEHGLDVLRQEGVDEPVVEGEALLVDSALAERHHPRPRDRETVCLEAEAGHQVDVFLHAVVVVAGDITGSAVLDSAGLVGEGIPDGQAAVVFAAGALDLVGGGGSAPLEAVGEGEEWHARDSTHGGPARTLTVNSGVPPCRDGALPGPVSVDDKNR